MHILSFGGRATRSEYWGLYLLGVVAGSALSIWDLNTITPTVGNESIVFLELMAILSSYILVIWCLLATTARRIRDADASWAWFVFCWAPFVFLIIGCWRSKADKSA